MINYSLLKLIKIFYISGQWLPSSTPKFPDIAIVDSHLKETLSENRVKISFTSNATTLSAIFIRPRKTAELVSWSFTDEIPATFNKTYFISIANGVQTNVLDFNVILKTEVNHAGPLLDLTVIGMKFDGQKDYTADYKKILKRVPDWAFAVDCIASVTSYVF